MGCYRTLPVGTLALLLLASALLPSSVGAVPAQEPSHVPGLGTSLYGSDASSVLSQVRPSTPPVPPSVGRTTVLINNTVYPGLYPSVNTLTAGTFDWGTAPAYDPHTNLFYVPVSNVTENPSSLPQGYLAAISPATDSLVRLIPVGIDPIAVAYDSSNGLLYVVNFHSNNISVVDPVTNSTIGSLGLPDGSSPDVSAAIDNSTGQLFLASPANDCVWDVNIANDDNTSITATQSATTTYVVYDNQTGEVYLVGSEVQVIGPNNNTLWKAIPLPAPTSDVMAGDPVVDWQTDELYVPWDNNTTAVELATNELGPTLTLSSEEGVTPAATFDPENHMIYVLMDDPAYNVTALNPATHEWAGSSPAIPAAPYRGMGYSTASERLLLVGKVESGSSGFVLMSPAPGLPIVGQPVTAVDPGQSYFDPTTGDIFVPEPGIGEYGNVTVVDPTTGLTLGYIPAGLDPIDVWVDSTTGYGYIANFGPPPAGHVDNLTIFDARTLAVTGSIPVGAEPYCMAYDPTTEDLYVANDESDNITIIDPVTNSSVGSISTSGFGATALLYDPSTTFLYAPGQVSGGDGEMAIINPVEEYVVYDSLYFEPSGAAYDAATGLIYVQDTNTSVYVLQDFDPATGSVVGSINLYEAAQHIAWDPVNDLLYVPARLNYTNGGFDANWVIEVNVTSGALVNLTVGEAPAGISLDSSSGEAFVSDVDAGSVVYIDPGTPAPSSGYTVTFQTVPTSCSVTFNGASFTNGEQETGVAAGTYPLVANTCTGETFGSWASTAGSVTSPDAASTTITVADSGTVTASYSTVPPGTYTVTFDVVPSTCAITFDGTPYTSGEQASDLAAGSYPLSANSCAGETFSSWSSTAGTVASTTSASTSVTVSATGTITSTFTATPPGTFVVTFTETGLPTGTSWSVTLAGSPLSSTTASISQAEPNGSYAFTIAAVTGYTSNITSGSVHIEGAGEVVEVGFTTSSSSAKGSGGLLSGSDWDWIIGLILALIVILLIVVLARPHRYPLVFTRTGLAEGTTWSVTMDSRLQSSTEASIVFHVPDGTHSFSIGPVPGYSGTPKSGVVEVKDDQRLVYVTFERTPPNA